MTIQLNSKVFRVLNPTLRNPQDDYKMTFYDPSDDTPPPPRKRFVAIPVCKKHTIKTINEAIEE